MNGKRASQAERTFGEVMAEIQLHEKKLEELQAEAIAIMRADRESMGITQTAHADSFGKTPSYLSQIERGRKSISSPRLSAAYTALTQEQERRSHGGEEDAKEARRKGRG